MKITIEPDSRNVEYIKSDWLVRNLIKSFLQALGISEADRERWDDVLWAEIDTNSPFQIEHKFRIMTCYLPDTIRNQQSWKYSTLFINGNPNPLLLLNGSPFWTKITRPSRIDNLPSDLINLSCEISATNYPMQSFNKLNQLKSLQIFHTFLTNITILENLTKLNALDLSGCSLLNDIKPLKKLTQINSLNLSYCDSLSDITPLANLTQLNSLSLSNCKSLSDITPLEKLIELNSLNLSNCKSLSDITALEKLTQINSLNLSYCDSLSDITPLANLTQLNSLSLSDCGYLSDITPLEKLIQLNSLNLSKCKSLSDITALEKLTQINSLNLSYCDSLSDITPLANLTQLNSLNLSDCGYLSDITPLEKLIQLNSLDLSDCKYASGIAPLAKLTQLNSLKLSGCLYVSDIAPLAKLTQLNSLKLSRCYSLTDITPLGKLEQLTSLDISYCDSLTDITPLKSFSKLNSLNLSYCNFISNLFPIQFIHQIKTISIEGCLRLTQFPNFKQLKQLYELKSSLHPTVVADILAHCALCREDWAFIEQNANSWTSELESGLKDSHPAAFDLATSLAIGSPHISFELSERLCQILQTDPLLDYRPWKQLFLGVFQRMGFSTLQNLSNTIAARSWPRGAIGGLAAIGEQLILNPDGKEWFAGWERAISAQHESNPSFLKPVAAPWCLALHCLGENALLDQWIARFTDPDDSSALDAVFLEFGNHRLGHNDAPGAFRHAMRIRATLVRDGLLADIASHYLEAQQADQAAELLFLLSAEDKRAELSLKLADIPHFLDNRDNLHRLLAACGKDAPAIGKLLAKAGMDETAFPSDADDKRQRAAEIIFSVMRLLSGFDDKTAARFRHLINNN